MAKVGSTQRRRRRGWRSGLLTLTVIVALSVPAAGCGSSSRGQGSSASSTAEQTEAMKRPPVTPVRRMLAREDLGQMEYGEATCYGSELGPLADQPMCPDAAAGDALLPARDPRAEARAVLDVDGRETSQIEFVLFDSRGGDRCWFAMPFDAAGKPALPAECSGTIECRPYCLEASFGAIGDDRVFFAGLVPAEAVGVVLTVKGRWSDTYAARGPVLEESGMRIFMVELPDSFIPDVRLVYQ